MVLVGMNIIAGNWDMTQIWNGLNGRKHIYMQQWPTMPALTAPLTGHRLQNPKRTSKSFGNICKIEDNLDGVWRDAHLHPLMSVWYAKFTCQIVDDPLYWGRGKFLENPRARINRKRPLRGRKPVSCWRLEKVVDQNNSSQNGRFWDELFWSTTFNGLSTTLKRRAKSCW